MVYLPKEYRHLFPEAKAPKWHKYGAKGVVIDGIKFPSIAEGRRYQELKLQQHAGIISELELQPEFVLQEKFKHQGKDHLAIKYRADFRYIHQGECIVEDVKGMLTAVYKIKKKMLLKRYPDINFKEIFAK